MENPSPNPLSESTHREIAALVRQISVAHHLDPDIHAELAAHIEDKLTAYLDGSEKPSEADALLLAKSHFGNPATLKSLFHQASPTAHHTTLTRKLAALVIATAAAYILGIALLLLCDFVAYCNRGDMPDDSFLPDLQQNLSQFFTALVIPLLLAIPLLRWSWRIQRGRPVWFQSARPAILTVASVVALASLFALRFRLEDSFSFVVDTGRIRMPMLHFRGWVLPTYLVCFFLQASGPLALWLWWCDRPRLWRTFIITLIMYIFMRTAFLDPIAVSPFDQVFYRSVLRFSSHTFSVALNSYTTFELPGILLATLIFLLLPRRHPKLPT